MNFERVSVLSATLATLDKLTSRSDDIELSFDLLPALRKITDRVTVRLGEELAQEFDIEEDAGKLNISVSDKVKLIARVLLDGNISIDMETTDDSSENIKKALGYSKTNKVFPLTDPSELIRELQAIRRCSTATRRRPST